MNVLLAKSLRENRRGTEIPKSRSGLNGLRFEHLEKNADHEKMDMEGVNLNESGDGGEDMGAYYELGSSANTDDGKKRTDCEISAEDEANLVVSHPSIGEGLKTHTRSNLGASKGSKMVS